MTKKILSIGGQMFQVELVVRILKKKSFASFLKVRITTNITKILKKLQTYISKYLTCFQ